MAITRVNSNATYSSSAVTSISVTLNVTAGNVVVLFIDAEQSPIPTITISDTVSTSWQTPTTVLSNHVAIWCAMTTGVIPTSNTSDTITVTLSSSRPYVTLAAVQYSGVATSNYIDLKHASYTTSQATTWNYGPFTTAQSNEVIVGGCVTYYSSSASISSPFSTILSKAFMVLGDNIVSTVQTNFSVPFASGASDYFAGCVYSLIGASAPASNLNPWLRPTPTAHTTHDT